MIARYAIRPSPMGGTRVEPVIPDLSADDDDPTIPDFEPPIPRAPRSSQSIRVAAECEKAQRTADRVIERAKEARR